MSGEVARYGQVWVSRDEAIGPINYLVVSSDAYNAAFRDRRVIAVEVDSRAIYEGTYREPIVDAGTNPSAPVSASFTQLTGPPRRQPPSRATIRSSRRSILPLGVFGTSGRTVTRRGYL